MENDNLPEIIERLKDTCRYKTDKELAKALGLTPQNFLGRKKSGGIKDTLILHAINKGINKDWLLTGEGEMFADRNGAVREGLAPYGEAEPQEPMDHRPRGPDPAQDVVKATRLTMDVMTSRHPEIKLALMKNLEQFAEAVVKADELEGCKIQLKEQDKKLKKMDDKIRHLETQVTELLKREPQCGSGAPGDGVPVPEKKAM